MKLFQNPDTKVIFASDDVQDPSIIEITADDIAGLKVQGYTVDSSAASYEESATGELSPVSDQSVSESDTVSSDAPAALTDPVVSAASVGDVPLDGASSTDASGTGTANQESDAGGDSSGDAGKSGTTTADSQSPATSSTAGLTADTGNVAADATEISSDATGAGDIATESTDAATTTATPSEIHLYFDRIKREIEGFGVKLEEEGHRFFDDLKAKILG